MYTHIHTGFLKYNYIWKKMIFRERNDHVDTNDGMTVKFSTKNILISKIWRKDLHCWLMGMR